MKLKQILYQFALTSTVYSSVVFAYVMVVNFTHLEWFVLPLTHIDMFPLNMRTDTVGVIAFIISGFSFLIMRLTR